MSTPVVGHKTAKCTKRHYKDRLAVKIALAQISHRDNPKRPKTEQRGYYCTLCRAYHLTSKPQPSKA